MNEWPSKGQESPLEKSGSEYPLEIPKVDPDYLATEINSLSDPGEFLVFRMLAPTHANSWVWALFNAARSAHGTKKLEYATAIKRFVEFVGKKKYQEILQSALTNESTIEELIHQGKKEQNPFQRLKSILKNQ